MTIATLAKAPISVGSSPWFDRALASHELWTNLLTGHTGNRSTFPQNTSGTLLAHPVNSGAMRAHADWRVCGREKGCSLPVAGPRYFSLGKPGECWPNARYQHQRC